MEKNEHIINYLKEYINMSDPRYAVLLKGKWGCGKTFFIQNLIDKWSKTNPDSDDEIVLKPIYISLYGISSTKVITEKIKTALNPFLYSKGVQTLKKILIGALKLTTKVNLDFNDDGKDDGSLSFDINSLNLLTEKNEKIKGQKILIFDDIERCKAPIDELFGYINNFVEHSQCKVILLADEGKIDTNENSKNLTYKDFKEKLIGQTFEIFPDYLNAINFFLKNANNKSLTRNKELIHKVFLASDTNNLRILRQCFTDFCRLEKLIDSEIKRHPKYNDFIKELLCYFIIFYCEYKSGNTNVESYQDFGYKHKISSDEYKTIQSKYESKYLSILTQNNFRHSSYSLKGEIIIYFIENGSLEKIFLNNALKENHFFSDSGIRQWEKLWNYCALNNSEFQSIYEQIKSEFENQQIDDIYAVLHICGIFLSLNYAKIIPYGRTKTVKITKENINRIIKKDTSNIRGGLLLSSAYGKQYSAIGSTEFKEIQKYFTDKITNKSTESGTSYLKKYFENLNDDSIGNIFDNMKKIIPDGSRAYEMTSIFKPIDIRVFAENIILLSNDSKCNFNLFIRWRYALKDSGISREMCGYHQGDLDSLKKFQSILNKKVKNIKSIDKYVLTFIITSISEAIEKIEKSKINEQFPSVW